jgi:putative copper export protein
VTVLARIAAVVLGVAAFLAGALVLQLARGLEDGALVDPSGTVVAAVPDGWAWLVGVAVLVLALVATLLARGDRVSWFLFAGVVLVLLVAGSLPLAPDWVAAGSSSLATWALAGLAIALGIRAPRPAPADQ